MKIHQIQWKILLHARAPDMSGAFVRGLLNPLSERPDQAEDGWAYLSRRRRNIFSASFGATPGRLHGHTAMQIPQA